MNPKSILPIFITFVVTSLFWAFINLHTTALVVDDLNDLRFESEDALTEALKVQSGQTVVIGEGGPVAIKSDSLGTCSHVWEVRADAYLPDHLPMPKPIRVIEKDSVRAYCPPYASQRFCARCGKRKIVAESGWDYTWSTARYNDLMNNQDVKEVPWIE